MKVNEVLVGISFEYIDVVCRFDKVVFVWDFDEKAKWS